MRFLGFLILYVGLFVGNAFACGGGGLGNGEVRIPEGEPLVLVILTIFFIYLLFCFYQILRNKKAFFALASIALIVTSFLYVFFYFAPKDFLSSIVGSFLRVIEGQIGAILILILLLIWITSTLLSIFFKKDKKDKKRYLLISSLAFVFCVFIFVIRSLVGTFFC